MNKVEQIDANFAVNTTIKRDGTRFYPVTAAKGNYSKKRTAVPLQMEIRMHTVFLE